MIPSFRSMPVARSVHERSTTPAYLAFVFLLAGAAVALAFTTLATAVASELLVPITTP